MNMTLMEFCAVLAGVGLLVEWEFLRLDLRNACFRNLFGMGFFDTNAVLKILVGYMLLGTFF